LEQTPSETVPEPVLPAVESGQIPVEARSEAPEEIAGEITPAQGSSEQVVVPVELAAEAQPDWNDLDAAMAWLEGLAAKQGADQETLSTTEEQRSQTPPTWVTQEMEKSQAEAQTSPGTSSLEQGQPIDAGITEVSQTLPVEQPVSELPSEPITQAVASPPQPLEVESIDNISPPVFEQTIPEPLPSENNAEISTVFSSAPAIEETTIEQQITAEKKTAPLKLPAEPTPAQDMDGDAAFAWLESLAAQQGADEGTLSTSIEERQIPPPTWILEQGEAESKTEAPQDVNEAVALINETAVVEPQASSPAEEQTVSPELLPVSEIPAIEVPSLRDEAIQPVETGSWIKEPEQPAPPEATAQAVTPVPMTLPEEEPLPAWLKDIDQPPLETSSLVAPESMDDLPDWLKGFETPLEGSPIQAGDESTSVSTWLQEQENHAPEEINPPAPIAEPVLALDDKPLQSIPLPTAANSAASASLEDLPTNGNPLIAQAQADLKAGNIDTALSSFNQAIEQGQNLDAVIQNLKDALNRHPVEISLWQTLGDAYMRNDQIQDALDAYTKAEELLR
jgi:hypothetical protein